MSTALPSIPELSLVIPVFNEAEVIGEVLWEIREFLARCTIDSEVLVIDDGSSDGTGGLVNRMVTDWPQARLLAWTRNVGQAAALYYGLQQARGRILILMDGDGQNDPGDIPLLLALLGDAKADMAVGVRTPRKDAWPRRMASRVANQVRCRLLKDGVTDAGCGLKAFHRRVIDAFIPVQTLYSFMPALAVGAGFSVVEMPVRHRPRRAGRSKYGIRQFLWRPLLDLFGIWWFTRRRCPLPPRALGGPPDGNATRSHPADPGRRLNEDPSNG